MIGLQGGGVVRGCFAAVALCGFFPKRLFPAGLFDLFRGGAAEHAQQTPDGAALVPAAALLFNCPWTCSRLDCWSEGAVKSIGHPPYLKVMTDCSSAEIIFHARLPKGHKQMKFITTGVSKPA